MIIRYGASHIIKTASTLSGLVNGWRGGLVKRAAKQMEAFDLNPEKYVYLRNRAVSSLELSGANQNWDAFEYQELADKYSTFIGKPVTVDHIGTDIIGTVLDSEFIPAHKINDDLGIPLLPYEETKKVLGSMVKKNREALTRIFDFADKNDLVRSSDEQMIVDAVAKKMCNCGWIENVWAVNREDAEQHTPGLIASILNCACRDSSMGCMVNQAICSVCGNIATGELPEHEDFCDHIRLHKGKAISIGSVTVVPYERNRDIEFFEDTLIKPFNLGGKAGGEGADKDAHLLEVFSNRKQASKEIQRQAYIETNPNPPQTIRRSPDAYVLIGDMPEKVEKNRNEFLEEKHEIIQKHIDEQSADGTYPKGAIVLINYEEDEVDAVIVEEATDDGVLVVAIDGIDEPVEIMAGDVKEIKEYPEDMGYESELEARDENPELHPEKRAAGLNKIKNKK